MSEVSPSRSSGYWSTNQSEDKKEEEESTHEQLQRFVWTQVDSLVNEFGVYGQILSPNEDYIACNVVYEEGIPHRLWLSIQTSAMQSFQRWIQRRFGTTQLEPFHEPGVGEFLLARYSVDKCLYRAKVEEVDKVDGELVVMVRYVDYGNTGEGLSMQDLAPWSPFLGRIPPQAHLCKLKGLPIACTRLLSVEEYMEFARIMRCLGKMQIIVHSATKNMLEVSLRSKQGEDVLYLVRSNHQLQDYFRGSDDAEAASPLGRDRSQEVSKFVECKVAKWLQGVDSSVGTGDLEITDVLHNEELPTKKEGSSENPWPKQDQIAKARFPGGAGKFKVNDSLVENLQSLERQPSSCQRNQGSVCPRAKDLQDTEVLLLEQAQLPVNKGLFKSLVVEMDKQGGVWLLPQDDATLLLLETIEDILEKAEEESQRTTLFEPPIESCWMVDVPPQILRVRVEDNLGRGGLIVVRSVDYGFAMSVKIEQLSSLPVDLKNMQGLAVYGKLLTSDSGTELQGALCDVLVNDGKVVLTPQSSSNQQGGEAMIDEIQWDPMAEHQAKPGKQKKEDLGTEVDGYISKQSTCAFYMNRGKCWKKHFCQDLHMLPRHGAVTVDSELTFMGQDYSVNYSQAPNRRLDDQNMVEAEYSAALSPTMYYLKFPKGLKGLLEDKRYYKQWWSNLQHFYSKEGSRLSLTSLPATGFSYVARIPTKGWHRILVKEMLDVEDQIIALLVDEGRQEVVDLGSVYDLDPSFSQLPHQAVLCYLAGVEPVTTDFGAHSTVAPLLQDAFLLVKPPMSLENPLMVEIMLGDQWLSDVLVSKGLVTQVKPLD